MNMQFKRMKEVKWVDFYGDQIPIVWIEELEQPGVVLTNICELLGLDYPSQFTKVKDNADMFMPCDVVINGRPTMTIPITKINSWLFRINPNKVSGYISRNGEDISKRDLLVKYQDECSIVLSDYWNHGVAINARETPYVPDAEGSECIGPVKGSRARLRRVMVNYCAYLEKEHNAELEIDELTDALRNVFGGFVDIRLVKDPTLASRGMASGRELYMIATMENCASDVLSSNMIQNMHPDDLIDIIRDYIDETIVNMGKTIRNKDTFNKGQGFGGITNGRF